MLIEIISRKALWRVGCTVLLLPFIVPGVLAADPTAVQLPDYSAERAYGYLEVLAGQIGERPAGSESRTALRRVYFKSISQVGARNYGSGHQGARMARTTREIMGRGRKHN